MITSVLQEHTNIICYGKSFGPKEPCAMGRVGGGGGGMCVFHQNVDGLLEFNWFHAGLCGLVIATAPFTSIFGFYLSASPL